MRQFVLSNPGSQTGSTALNLRDYEQTKFALAEIVRSAVLRGASSRSREIESASADVFARLAEDRFMVAVVGRFNRGKTSLMNALLSIQRLPVGILPLTSTITTVSYGSSELATIEYRNRTIPDRVPLDDVSEYVTERGNPGNARGVKAAHIQLPAELLRRGLYLVDTPGIGSTAENDRTTHNFLPEADAVILVTSFESPLSADEVEIIKALRVRGRHTFYVINKRDLVSEDERARVLEYTREVLAGAGVAQPQLFGVSTLPNSGEGVDELGKCLVRFLIERKREEFLRAMRDRITDLLNVLPNAHNERAELRALLTGAPVRDEDPSEPSLGPTVNRTFSRCSICERVARSVIDYLCSQQYELTTSPDARESFAAAGGYCQLHTWQYAVLANARAACIAASAVADRVAASLRILAARDGFIDTTHIDELLPSKVRCQACQLLHGEERDAIGEAASAVPDDRHVLRSAYCLKHFRDVLVTVQTPDFAHSLIDVEVGAIEHLAEDMRRYVLKIDGVRRSLLSTDEREADQRGLALLAGSRGMNGVATQ
jgi:ribosome biogenesis GTPase A